MTYEIPDYGYTCPDGDSSCEDNVNEAVGKLKADLAKEREYKNGAYHERNMLVAALSRLFPAHLAQHVDKEGEEPWDSKWRWIVFIDIPKSNTHSETLQLAWHIEDTQLSLFAHLKEETNRWDNHTTQEKYERLATLRNVTDYGCSVCGDDDR